jgi:hypothetical protein
MSGDIIEADVFAARGAGYRFGFADGFRAGRASRDCLRRCIDHALELGTMTDDHGKRMEWGTITIYGRRLDIEMFRKARDDDDKEVGK